MYGNDWTMPAGHRLGVLLTGANQEWWAHVPTGQQVDVKSASITLPYLGCRRSSTIEGGPSVKLESYLKNAPFAVDAATITGATDPGFALPPDQGDCTAKEIAQGGPVGTPGTGSGPSAHGCIDRRRFKFRLHARRGDRVVKVTAFVNGHLAVRRRGHNLKTLTLTKLPLGRFKVKILTRTARGHSTRSLRTYKGCRKSRPHVTHPS
jgi:hypothetical protein